MAQRIQLRRGTAAEWAAANPVLAVGEPGVETDTGKQKFGNGTTAWTALPYASKGDQGIPGVADDASVAQQVTNGTATKAALNATYATASSVTGKVDKTVADAAYRAVVRRILRSSADLAELRANYENVSILVVVNSTGLDGGANTSWPAFMRTDLAAQFPATPF